MTTRYIWIYLLANANSNILVYNSINNIYLTSCPVQQIGGKKSWRPYIPLITPFISHEGNGQVHIYLEKKITGTSMVYKTVC